MSEKHLKNPVLPYTLKGKMLVLLLRSLYAILALFKGKKWQEPLKDFEENPCNMSKRKEHLLFFGYKYYYQPPLLYPEATKKYFKQQTLDFTPPSDFIVQSEITISAGGDLMPYEWIKKESTQHLWDEVGDFFFDADIVFANLETPIVTHRPPSYVPEVMLNDMHFNGSEEMFEIFSGNSKYKGYDVLSTANNHSWDMGEEGVIETLNFLEQKGVAHTGTARSREERNQTLIIQRKGIKVAFISYTYSLNKFKLPAYDGYMVNHLRLNKPDVDVENIKKDVLNAKNRGADIVVLALHAGNAYQPLPSENTIDTYHKVFEACGVDIILGTHPHNPQPMEKYEYQCPISQKKKHGFIIYSLSDFVAYDIFVWGRIIPLLKMTIQKGTLHGRSHSQLTHVEVLPVYNWGKKDISTGKELRFLDFYKLLEKIEANQAPSFLTTTCLKEIATLKYFWENYFLPDIQVQKNAIPHHF